MRVSDGSEVYIIPYGIPLSSSTPTPTPPTLTPGGQHAGLPSSNRLRRSSLALSFIPAISDPSFLEDGQSRASPHSSSVHQSSSPSVWVIPHVFGRKTLHHKTSTDAHTDSLPITLGHCRASFCLHLHLRFLLLRLRLLLLRRLSLLWSSSSASLAICTVSCCATAQARYSPESPRPLRVKVAASPAPPHAATQPIRLTAILMKS